MARITSVLACAPELPPLLMISGMFTTKLFRTWAGTMQALVAPDSRRTHHSAAGSRRELALVIRDVATILGNTPAVCRKCYILAFLLERQKRPANALMSSCARSKPSSRSRLERDEGEPAVAKD